MMTKSLTFPASAAALLMLAACNSSTPTPGNLPPATADQQFTDCIVGDPNALIGIPASQAAAGHNGPVRVIPPGMVVTQDYDTKRLNLKTNASGTVLRAYCG